MDRGWYCSRSNARRVEDGVAAEHLTGQDVLQVLDYPAYFHLLGVPPADGHDAVLEALAHDRLIKRNEAGGYDITNLGAILFARRLAEFPRLKRKAVRLIRYRGSGRMEAEREQVGTYAKSGAPGSTRSLTPSRPSDSRHPCSRRLQDSRGPRCSPTNRSATWTAKSGSKPATCTPAFAT